MTNSEQVTGEPWAHPGAVVHMDDVARPSRVRAAERAKEYRDNARAEVSAMQASRLPEKREKHRAAAETWLRMARSAEAQAAGSSDEA